MTLHAECTVSDCEGLPVLVSGVSYKSCSREHLNYMHVRQSISIFRYSVRISELYCYSHEQMSLFTIVTMPVFL